jgi:predicted CoA-substrate-specific enzyme activase
MQYYLGIDVGSVSTKLAVLDSKQKLAAHIYLPTRGEPVNAVSEGMAQIQTQIPEGSSFSCMSVTGSGRHLIASIIGADFIKNEVTAQAAASLRYFPDTRTVIEIGGQDSKIILIKDGLMIDFGMNTVCAAGTGSFLDHQAQRLGLNLDEFGELAIKSQSPVKITGRCTVFAESDMIHKQQSGGRLEDIVYGLCQTLVHNYLTGVAAGKDIQTPIIFQGGLAHNRGIVRALEEAMGTSLTIPQHPELMGAIGAALLAQPELLHKISNSVTQGAK